MGGRLRSLGSCAQLQLTCNNTKFTASFSSGTRPAPGPAFRVSMFRSVRVRPLCGRCQLQVRSLQHTAPSQRMRAERAHGVRSALVAGYPRACARWHGSRGHTRVRILLCHSAKVRCVPGLGGPHHCSKTTINRRRPERQKSTAMPMAAKHATASTTKYTKLRRSARR